MSRKEENPRANIYARITDRIVADLERGVRPWVKPWNAANAAGRITRPLRAQRHALSGHQCRPAVVGSRRARFHVADLDDVQAGARTRRSRPQRRERNDGGLCKQDHQDRDR